jgi:hypothetical protein
MGLPELKNKILMQIENADEATLLKVAVVFDEFSKVENTELKEAIENARLQIYNNETITHDLVMEETREKYPKYFRNES